jgi:hypothetical protein
MVMAVTVEKANLKKVFLFGLGGFSSLEYFLGRGERLSVFSLGLFLL